MMNEIKLSAAPRMRAAGEDPELGECAEQGAGS
jgi:hypothetical protein